jgi:hypothetical protein
LICFKALKAVIISYMGDKNDKIFILFIDLLIFKAVKAELC